MTWLPTTWRATLSVALSMGLSVAPVRADQLDAGVAAAPLTVQSVRLRGYATYQLPLATGGAPKAAARINRRLYEALAVETPPPIELAARARWVQQALNPEGVGGLRSLNFRVQRNDGRLLVLHLGGDACGAYCEPIDQQRLFDAQTGTELETADFFTADGRRQLARTQTAQLLREAAARIRDVRRHPRLEDDLESYERCVSNWRKWPATMWALVLLDDGHWQFETGGCSAHVNRSADRLDHFEQPADLELLRPLMTPYGRWLVLGERRALTD
jgi:hypothetical protein